MHFLLRMCKVKKFTVSMHYTPYKPDDIRSHPRIIRVEGHTRERIESNGQLNQF